MTLVKICGVRSHATAIASLMAGADMLGFVFAPSRRQVAPETAARILTACRELFPRHGWTAVGVFANQPLEFLIQTITLCELDAVQLSGEESPDYAKQVPRPLFRAIHLPPCGKHASSRGRGELARILAELGALYIGSRLLLDTSAAGVWGGTGQSFDWRAVEGLAQDCVLAGGLTPLNVRDAIAAAHPWAVDVSSGVEADGEKDPRLISTFISEVRRCDSDAA